MRRIWVAAVVVLALGGASIPSAASRNPTATFLISDGVGEDGALVLFQVRPDRHEIRLGASVAWTNVGILPHELEERRELFRWGPIPPGETESFRPWAAGTYGFREANEDELGGVGRWDRGTFLVRPFLNPWRRGRAFVRWATQPPPQGFVYDVQRSRGFGERWRWWRRGVTTTHGSFGWFRESASGSCVGARARLRDADDPTRRLGWGATHLYCVVV